MKKLLILMFSISLITLSETIIKAVEPVTKPVIKNKETNVTKPIAGTPDNSMPNQGKLLQNKPNTATPAKKQSSENKSNVVSNESGGISLSTIMSKAGTAIKNAANSVGKSISNATSSAVQKITGKGSNKTSTTSVAQQKVTAEVSKAQFKYNDNNNDDNNAEFPFMFGGK